MSAGGLLLMKRMSRDAIWDVSGVHIVRDCHWGESARAQGDSVWSLQIPGLPPVTCSQSHAPPALSQQELKSLLLSPLCSKLMQRRNLPRLLVLVSRQQLDPLLQMSE
jgi:hypothetical protein